jgi:hypothetical protein
MDKEGVSMVLAVAAVLISIVTLTIAYAQMKIASAKTKLDLYNRRFSVYSAAFDLCQSAWNSTHDQIKEKQIVFTKSYRESLFLFDRKDGICATLGRIQQKGGMIHAYEQKKYEIESGISKDGLDLTALHRASVPARMELEDDMKLLERQIEKYIQFENITGWHFLK